MTSSTLRATDAARAAPDITDDKLPFAALLALAMTGFICIITETLPAGLLPQMAEGLAVSSSLAGQTVTAYAVGSVLAAVPLTIATRGWRRRNVLLLTIVGFLVFNTLTALSSNYWLTLIARFFAGVAAGLAWSLLAGYARRMVLPHQQGMAMTIAMVGTPIALSLGVPLGTWLGGSVGWRSAFGIMSALTLVLIVWVLAKVPDYPGQSGRVSMPLRKVLTTPGVGVAVWGLSFGGAATLLQTALADSAGDGADVALSMNVVAWNSVIAAGGVLGGVLLDRWGPSSFPWAMLVLLALGMMIVWSAKAHGFQPGPRVVVAGH